MAGVRPPGCGTLHLEHDNLRSALDWCMSPAQSAEQRDRALDFATALWRFWVKRGFLGEGRRWLDRAVEMTPKSSPSRGARPYSGLANLADFQGDFASTATYAMNSVALGREAVDLSSVAFGLGIQTVAAAEAGDVGLAVRLSGECREAARASGDSWTAGPALYVLGFLAIREGDFDKASRIYEEEGNEHIRGPLGLEHFPVVPGRPPSCSGASCRGQRVGGQMHRAVSGD